MKEQETLNEDYFDENQYEIDNRIRNLYWTVSGNYGENIKLDTVSFSRSPWVSLYDAVKQGAFSRYFDRNAFGLYLVKKLYYGADEQALTNVAQLAVDSAVYRKISAERKGVQEIRKKAFSDLLEYDFTRLASYYLGQIKICMMQQAVRGSVSHEQARMRQVLDFFLAELEDTYDTMEIIRVTDKLYNWLVDPYFEKNHGDLAKVLAVTMEELKEFSWKDYLEEEAKEEELTQVLNQVNQAVTQTGEASTEQEEKRESRMKRVLVDAEAAAKMYSYIELNYGRSYLKQGEQERLNRSLCRGAHADCSLYFTDGILSGMVKRNYQSEYARRAKIRQSPSLRPQHSRVAKRNIEQLSDTLRRALTAAKRAGDGALGVRKHRAGKTLEAGPQPGQKAFRPGSEKGQLRICGFCSDRRQRFPEKQAEPGGPPGVYHQRGLKHCGNSPSGHGLLYLLGLYGHAALPGLRRSEGGK